MSLKNSITFIIPAFNAEKTISRCIESVLAQDLEKEVIVVDNASTDSTAEIIKKYPVKYVIEKKRGPAAAKNRGLALSNQNFDYIAFIDSDVILPNKWAENAVKLLSTSENIAGVGGPGKSLIKNYISEIFDYLLYGRSSDQKKLFVNSLATMDVMYRKEAIKDLYFNEELFAAEDPDFNFRVLKRNYKLIYSEELWVFHYNPTTLKDIWKKWYNYGKYYPLPFFWNKHIYDLGLWLRIGFLPLLICLIILCIFDKIKLIILFIFTLVLPSIYLYIGFKTGLRNPNKLFVFSFLHTFKQFVQIIGIWVGFIRNFRLYGKSKQ